MPRFAHRRAIVFFVLLCQILAAGLVHVPMAQAAQSPPAAVEPAHCHDSAPTDGNHTDGTAGALATQATASGTTHQTSDPGHHCKSGFCVCVCLNAPAALPDMLATGSPLVSHPPLLVIDRVAVAPVRAAVFFRPPI